MAKKSVTGGRGITGIQFSGKTQARVPSATRSDAMPRANQTVQKNTPYTNQPMVDKGRVAKTVNSFRSGIGAVANKYGAPIGPQNTGVVPGGRGIMALNNVRMKPTAGAPRASVSVQPQPASAPIKARVKPAETIRTFVREKLTPIRKTGPQMALNRVTGNTTGFTSGTTTGKTISKAGVATKTPMSASRRAEQNAFNKGGVAGPSRGGGGGMGKSSGGASRSTGGGNTGRGDVGAGRRGGRG